MEDTTITYIREEIVKVKSIQNEIEQLRQGVLGDPLINVLREVSYSSHGNYGKHVHVSHDIIYMMCIYYWSCIFATALSHD